MYIILDVDFLQFCRNFYKIYDMDLYIKKLKKSNLSSTKPRQAIFNILKNSGHKAFTMNELVNICKIFADRSTVYRSVNALEQAQIIKKVYQGWKYKIELSDDFFGHHHHFICQKCQYVSQIDLPETIEQRLADVTSNFAGQINSHTIEFYGFCQNCLKNK